MKAFRYVRVDGGAVEAGKLVRKGATLKAGGSDLLDDPSLRQGLVNLWAAEAESAGLQLAALHCIGTGVRDSSEGYALAELSSGGEQYVLRATRCIKQYDAIVVHADRPNRWEVL